MRPPQRQPDTQTKAPSGQRELGVGLEKKDPFSHNLHALNRAGTLARGNGPHTTHGPATTHLFTRPHGI